MACVMSCGQHMGVQFATACPRRVLVAARPSLTQGSGTTAGCGCLCVAAHKQHVWLLVIACEHLLFQ